MPQKTTDSIGSISSILSTQRQCIDLKKLKHNDGQIAGFPKNPRLIRDEKFHKLVTSIRESPEMLDLRELLVVPHDDSFVVIAGNMRLKALKELNIKQAPCKVLSADTPLEKLKEYAVKDNIGYGDWDFNVLGADWDSQQLEEWGVTVPYFGHEANNINEDDLDMDEEFDPVGVSKGNQRIVFIFDDTDSANVFLKKHFPTAEPKKFATAWHINLTTTLV